VSVAAAPTPTLTEAVLGLLRLVAGRDGTVAVHQRTLSGVDNLQPIYLTARQLDHDVLPPLILQALEQGLSLRLYAASVDGAGSTTLSRLPALVATWSLPYDVSRRLVTIRPDALADILARLADFGVAPTALVQGSGPRLGDMATLTAVWALDTPLDVLTERAEGEVLARVADLAQRLGADVPDTARGLGALTIPLPGSRLRIDQADDIATCPLCDPSRIYSLADLERAIQEAA
jgi:hypothetical protein